jgi:tetratricopeptide (TPR) repeat protein
LFLATALLPLDPALLNNLAEMRRREGRYAEARSLLRRALSLEPSPADSAAVLHNLGEIHRLYGEYTAAERRVRESLALKESLYGLDHPQVARGLNTLARIQEESGAVTAAEAGYLRALEIWNRHPGRFPLEHAATLTNLGRLYHAQGRWPDAEVLHRRALAVAGARDPAVEAAILHNLANLYASTHRFPEAEPLYRRSLELREGALGPDHPAVATLLADYTRALRLAKQGRRARPLEARIRRLAARRHTVDVRSFTQSRP